MKIHLLSDLHTEFIRGNVKDKLKQLVAPSDTLVLAGDIAMGRNNVLEIVRFFSGYYKDVIYIPGNHEYYSGLTLGAFDVRFKNRLPANVHFQNPGQIVIDNVEFLCATLWTNFREDPLAERAARNGINDFSRIAELSTNKMKSEFYQHLAMLKYFYNHRDQAKKQVFITHFMPAVECIAPRWRDAGNLLNKYFANDLGEWIKTLDSCHWLFGHTHDSVDVTMGQCRLLAHPLGYPNERQEPYQPLIIEV